MGGVFIPDLDEGDIAMQALLKPGSSLSESVEVSQKIENILLDNFPEVKTVVARIGVADVPTDPMPMDIDDMYIILEKDPDQWVSADTKQELIAKIREELSVFAGVNFVFSQPIELRFNELLTGVREDVAVKLYGEDLDVLAAKAQEMAQIIQTVPGAADVSVEATSGLPQMTVRYNRGRIARYGLNIEKLNQYISSAFAGGGGDNIGASPYNSSSADDTPTLDVLNAIGVQASAVGNHEFDRGVDDLTGRVVDETNFPYLGANVYDRGSQNVADGLEEYSIVDVGGVEVAGIGVVV